jgi:hypothetical protein
MVRRVRIAEESRDERRVCWKLSWWRWEGRVRSEREMGGRNKGERKNRRGRMRMSLDWKWL